MRMKEECDRRRERNLQWDERHIKSLSDGLCINLSWYNYSGIVPGWRMAGEREQQPSNICLNIRLTPEGNLCKMLSRHCAN